MGDASPHWDAFSFYSPSHSRLADFSREGELLLWGPGPFLPADGCADSVTSARRVRPGLRATKTAPSISAWRTDVVLRERPDESLRSIVAPFLNEEVCVHELVTRVRAAIQSTGHRYGILLIDDGIIDDGSSDSTPQRIGAERASDPQINGMDEG